MEFVARQVGVDPTSWERVTGKENILFAIAEASLGRPDDPVRQVVYPAVAGGEGTLRELVHEFRTKGGGNRCSASRPPERDTRTYSSTVRPVMSSSWPTQFRSSIGQPVS